MKRLLSLLLMAGLLLNVACKNDEPQPDPGNTQPTVVGPDYYTLCADLIGMSHSNMHNQFTGQGFTCTNQNQTSATDMNYTYERRDGNVSQVYAIITRDNIVVAVTAGEQWDYGYGDCAEMRDRYVSLLALADYHNRPWSSSTATLNDQSFSTMDTYLEALRTFPITRNCTDGEQLVTGADFTGTDFVVRGAASIKNEQFLQWYTGPSYAITLLSRPYADAQ
mgnify:CR=1 FL=1